MEKLEAEINYILYRLQALGEEPDRIRAYKERIGEYMDGLWNIPSGGGEMEFR